MEVGWEEILSIFINEKKIGQEIWLIILDILPEDPVFFFLASTWQLITTCNSSSRGFNTPFSCLWAPGMHMVHRHNQAKHQYA